MSNANELRLKFAIGVFAGTSLAQFSLG